MLKEKNTCSFSSTSYLIANQSPLRTFLQLNCVVFVLGINYLLKKTSLVPFFFSFLFVSFWYSNELHIKINLHFGGLIKAK